MKITKRQLKQIIKEELEKSMSESMELPFYMRDFSDEQIVDNIKGYIETIKKGEAIPDRDYEHEAREQAREFLRIIKHKNLQGFDEDDLKTLSSFYRAPAQGAY